MEKMQAVIRHYTDLNEEQIEEVVSHTKPESYKKNTNLFEQDEKCEYIAFIEKGILAMYNEEMGIRKGVMDFFDEGKYFTDMYSYLTGAKRRFNFYFLEDAVVTKLYKTDIESLYRKSNAWERMGRRITERAYINQVRYTYDAKFLSIKERYLKLMHNEFDIIQRVPQYLIAAYLDTTPETLSRIRKKISEERRRPKADTPID